MSRRKSNGNGHKPPPPQQGGQPLSLAELAASKKKLPSEVRILTNTLGSSGLKTLQGFIQEAYNTQLTWPTVYPLYNKLRRSMPEIVMIRQAFTAWSRNVKVEVDLPDEPTDDDKKYKDFVAEVFEDMDGGTTGLLDTMVNHVPFMGWGWWEILPCVRDPEWKPPKEGDEWRSQFDDGLFGLRRLAWRDTSTFHGWDFDERKNLRGMKQLDYPNPEIVLPLNKSLHLTFGDPNNPEGLSPLEAVWRLERMRYGFEIVMGIGGEHAAGYLNVKKVSGGEVSPNDAAMVKEAARNVLTAQEGNYALWPTGFEGELMDVNFAAAGNLLAVIKHYSTVVLSVYTMQWMALNTMTDTGALASAQDSSQLGVFTFNSMMDGFAAQLDEQVGKKLWEWNKMSFPGVTKRPRLRFSHVDKSLELSDMGTFIGQLNGIVPLGEEDFLAIRKRSGFLPLTNPEIEDSNLPGGKYGPQTPEPFIGDGDGEIPPSGDLPFDDGSVGDGKGEIKASGKINFEGNVDAELLASITDDDIEIEVELGGAGSGFHGHAGRSGKKGGSAPKGTPRGMRGASKPGQPSSVGGEAIEDEEEALKSRIKEKYSMETLAQLQESWAKATPEQKKKFVAMVSTPFDKFIKEQGRDAESEAAKHMSFRKWLQSVEQAIVLGVKVPKKVIKEFSGRYKKYKAKDTSAYGGAQAGGAQAGQQKQLGIAAESYGGVSERASAMRELMQSALDVKNRASVGLGVAHDIGWARHPLDLLYEWERARELGGKGSGHKGHKGIPGHRGGSLPRGAGGSEAKEPETKEPETKEPEIRNPFAASIKLVKTLHVVETTDVVEERTRILREMAERYGIDPNRVVYLSEIPMGEGNEEAIGQYDPKSKKIMIYSPAFDKSKLPDPEHTLVHELTHAKMDDYGERVFLEKHFQPRDWSLGDAKNFADEIGHISPYSDHFFGSRLEWAKEWNVVNPDNPVHPMIVLGLTATESLPEYAMVYKIDKERAPRYFPMHHKMFLDLWGEKATTAFAEGREGLEILDEWMNYTVYLDANFDICAPKDAVMAKVRRGGEVLFLHLPANVGKVHNDSSGVEFSYPAPHYGRPGQVGGSRPRGPVDVEEKGDPLPGGQYITFHESPEAVANENDLDYFREVYKHETPAWRERFRAVISQTFDEYYESVKPKVRRRLAWEYWESSILMAKRMGLWMHSRVWSDYTKRVEAGERRAERRILESADSGEWLDEFGGPGSGYGRPHLGRPGEQGGSKPRGDILVSSVERKATHALDVAVGEQDTLAKKLRTVRKYAVNAIREKYGQDAIVDQRDWTGDRIFGVSVSVSADVPYAEVFSQLESIFLGSGWGIDKASENRSTWSLKFGKGVDAHVFEITHRSRILGLPLKPNEIDTQAAHGHLANEEGWDLGGPGSGYGDPHQGRPGERGGSLPRSVSVGTVDERPQRRSTVVTREQMIELPKNEHINLRNRRKDFRGELRGNESDRNSVIGSIWKVGDNQFEVYDVRMGWVVAKLPGVYKGTDFQRVGTAPGGAGHDDVKVYVLLESETVGELGGPGSGYDKPHRGRPGKVGGSLPRDGGPDSITVSDLPAMIPSDVAVNYHNILGMREPWQMTKEEFAHPEPLPMAGPGELILYHRLYYQADLDSVLNEGLLTSKKIKGGEGPRGVIWAVDTPTGWSDEGVVVGVRVSSDRAEKAGVGQYMIHGDVLPEDIVWVDRPSYSSVSAGYRIGWERASEYADRYHKAYVEDALNSGLPVPSIVLLDYPDLVASHELGGPGSGYDKPHRGRPGQRGGSLPRKGGDAGAISVSNVDSGEKNPDEWAAELYNTANEVEPALTATIEAIASKLGGRADGLEFRIKSQGSTARKIQDKMRFGNMTAEEAAKSITDMNRYTLVFDDDTLVDGYNGAASILENSGYTIYDTKRRNYFGSYEHTGYEGLNTVWYNPDTGAMFELQFHTEHSLKVKADIHPIYERWRSSPSQDECTNLLAEMRRLWGSSGYKPPKNFELLGEPMKFHG